MIIRQHVQHVKNSKKLNPTPPFAQTSFLKFVTRPRDRKWHISKLATLPRAPYQPHAKNNNLIKKNPKTILHPFWTCGEHRLYTYHYTLLCWVECRGRTDTSMTPGITKVARTLDAKWFQHVGNGFLLGAHVCKCTVVSGWTSFLF